MLWVSSATGAGHITLAEPDEHNETSASASTSDHDASPSSIDSSVVHSDGHV